jgi:hypothetical protein
MTRSGTTDEAGHNGCAPGRADLRPPTQRRDSPMRNQHVEQGLADVQIALVASIPNRPHIAIAHNVWTDACGRGSTPPKLKMRVPSKQREGFYRREECVMRQMEIGGSSARRARHVQRLRRIHFAWRQTASRRRPRRLRVAATAAQARVRPEPMNRSACLPLRARLLT